MYFLEIGQVWLLGNIGILEICQFWLLGILEILEILQFWLLVDLGIVVLQIFEVLGTWEYRSSSNPGVREPGNSGPPGIWGPGNLGIVVLQLYGVLPNTFWEGTIFGTCSQKMLPLHFWEWCIFRFFLKNGSLGQTTTLARFGSKNCVETQSQSPESSHTSPDSASTLGI